MISQAEMKVVILTDICEEQINKKWKSYNSKPEKKNGGLPRNIDLAHLEWSYTTIFGIVTIIFSKKMKA